MLFLRILMRNIWKAVLTTFCKLLIALLMLQQTTDRDIITVSWLEINWSGPGRHLLIFIPTEYLFHLLLHYVSNFSSLRWYHDLVFLFALAAYFDVDDRDVRQYDLCLDELGIFLHMSTHQLVLQWVWFERASCRRTAWVGARRSLLLLDSLV